MSQEDERTQIYPEKDIHARKIDYMSFESWRLAVETNNVGAWDVMPEKYVDFVKEYMHGQRYQSDTEAISDYALKYATTLDIARDEKDAWIFDVDETLILNLGYYEIHGYRSEVVDDKSISEWKETAQATAIAASLRLYTKLQQLGFKIFLVSGRTESQRKCTVENLVKAGFTNYDKLFLRGDLDFSKPGTLYKSEKRQELVDEGYIIHGNIVETNGVIWWVSQLHQDHLNFQIRCITSLD